MFFSSFLTFFKSDHWKNIVISPDFLVWKFFAVDISLNPRRPLGSPEVQAAFKMESFVTIVAKLSILDVCEGPTCASDVFKMKT